MTRDQWRMLANTLLFLGGASAFAFFVALQALIVYYTMKRPHVPAPEVGWTVRLYWSWTPPSYGTAQEDARLRSVSTWFFPAFAVAAAGKAIQYYKLKIDIFKSSRGGL